MYAKLWSGQNMKGCLTTSLLHLDTRHNLHHLQDIPGEEEEEEEEVTLTQLAPVCSW